MCVIAIATLGVTGCDAGSVTASGEDHTEPNESGDETDELSTPPSCSFYEKVCATTCCPDAARQIALPIEVLGPEQTTVERSFVLRPGMVSEASRLWLQVNNLGYEDKGSVQINDGDWQVLRHDNVDMHNPELARGGMVHGGFNTIRFSIPADGVEPELNVVRFRFERSDGLSIGFRVVALNVLNESGEPLLPMAAFAHDDPLEWSAPKGSAGEAEVREGERLWRNGALWNHYLPEGRTGFWYDAVIPARQRITATCADCHTHDGRDLELFSYSNHSIIERAKFHGLSQEQGESIAAYIRSLSEKADVGRWGRPWNPPYQPGPAVAGLPIEKWPIGAGLNAVLDEDADMARFMFPNGITREAVQARFDSDTMVDRTTLPLAIQFPDWKHWLPMIHPKDAFNHNGWYDSLEDKWLPRTQCGASFSGACVRHPGASYRHLRDFLESKLASGEQPTRQNKDAWFEAIEDYWWDHRQFFEQGSGTQGSHWRTKDFDGGNKVFLNGVKPGTSMANKEMAATSVARLMAVKYFEINHEFGLADKAQHVLDPDDQVPPRQWLGDEYQVFEVPPHFTACFYDPSVVARGKNCNHFDGQPIETGKYESTSWYHLQSIINGGNGQISHNSPVDYNYQPNHVTSAASLSGVAEPLRYYHQLNTMYQTRTWSGATTPNDGKGFRIRVMGPWLFYGLSDSGNLDGWEIGEFPALLNEIKPGLTMWVLDALLEQFLSEMDDPINALETWNREAPHGSSNALDPKGKTMAEIRSTVPHGLMVGRWADKYYGLVEHFAEAGVGCEILQRYIDWGEKAWTELDWEPLRELPRAHVVLDERSDAMVAVVANEGESPALEWFVNGEQVEPQNERELPHASYSVGDEVEVRLRSGSACVSKSRAESNAVRIANSSQLLEN
ncbi:MAG: hypothetical protein AAF605_03245 [Myxococcota bacterium]